MNLSLHLWLQSIIWGGKSIIWGGNFPNNNASKKREEKIQYLHVFKTPRKNKRTYELHQCIRRKKEVNINISYSFPFKSKAPTGISYLWGTDEYYQECCPCQDLIRSIFLLIIWENIFLFPEGVIAPVWWRQWFKGTGWFTRINRFRQENRYHCRILATHHLSGQEYH